MLDISEKRIVLLMALMSIEPIDLSQHPAVKPRSLVAHDGSAMRIMA